MIRSLVIDDEPDSRFVLSNLLQTRCPQVSVVGEADGVDAALELIERTAPDLLFLDIRLGPGDGFEILDRVQSTSPQVIFVTAFDDHALRAFRYSAVDYLLKPVAESDLLQAVDKVAQRRQENTLPELEVLLHNLRALQASGQKMAIPTVNGLDFLFLKDIVRLEASGAYTEIHRSEGRPMLSTRSLQEYEDLLPRGLFIRVHTSHIINLNKVVKYEKGRGGHLIMENQSIVEVAIRRRGDFLRQILR
jgi:two-component system LytT family response regulator